MVGLLTIPAQAQTYDLVINHGRVIDPETSLDGIRHLGIKDGQIAAVSQEPLRGAKVMDASGLIVAPGFIDFHAHGQNIPADRMQAFDGVTTALELESGILPVAAWYNNQKQSGRVLNYGVSAAWTYARVSALEDLEPKPNLKWFQDAYPMAFEQVTLGRCFLKEKQYEEAEQQVVEGYHNLRRYSPGGNIPVGQSHKFEEVLHDLMAVAKALHKPEDVQKWQKELDELPR